MPQLDIFSFSSQIFWFIVIFWGLYIVVYSTFIFPFAFILKVRSYLSVLAPKVGLIGSTKFSFDQSNSSYLDQLFNSLNTTTDLVSASHNLDLNSSVSVINNTFDSLHKDTNFLAFCLYVSLKTR